MTEQNFLPTSEKKSYDVVKLTRLTQISSEVVSQPNVDQSKQSLVPFINTMT